MKIESVTFHSIDEANGTDLCELKEGGFPLEIWLAQVYNQPIGTFSVFDLARSCRQHSVCTDYLPVVVPLCIAELEKEPLAGELYDGELLAAVIGLPQEYWDKYPDQKVAVESIATATFDKIEDDEQLMRKVFKFLGGTDWNYASRNFR